jgi:hypothetical protein
MSRIALPQRRPNETREIIFDERSYLICVGFDDAGMAKEVFCDGPKTGSAMQHLIADACVVISLALQHGLARADLEHSLGRVPRWTDGQEAEGPASVIGLIVGVL